MWRLLKVVLGSLTSVGFGGVQWWWHKKFSHLASKETDAVQSRAKCAMGLHESGIAQHVFW